MNLRTLRRWNTPDIDALTISSSTYQEQLLPIACFQRSRASMYKGPLTNSLHCSEFIELTLITGNHSHSITLSAICCVLMARFRYDVQHTSKSSPASFISSPARFASAFPFSDSSTSTQPVNRFFWFYSLSPWRIITIFLYEVLCIIYK